MASEKALLLNWVLRQEWDGTRTFAFDSTLERFARSVLAKSAMGAAAYVEANAARRWNGFISQLEQLHKRGIVPLLVELDSVARTGRFVYSDPNSRDVSRERALRSVIRPLFLRAIDALDNREYEALACVIAQYAGADRVYLTPPGNEGGVDFFALIRSPGRTHIFSANSAPIRIIGQCKKYKQSINVDRLRQFRQTISDVCHQSELIEQHVPSWFRSASGPVVGWMIGHSGFQTGALTVAKNHGMVTSDSLDLAELASQCRRFKLCETASEKTNSLASDVKDVLASQ